MDPYYIFPRELWEKIFNLVENPQDKLNLMRAHPNLQEQFREKEEELLFLSALPMILDNLESSARLPDWHCEKKDRQKPFFTLRLVSSSTCKVADKWLESYCEKSEGALQPASFLSGQSFTQELLEKFTENFPNHPGTRAPLCRYAFLVIPKNSGVPHAFRTNPAHALAMEAEQSEKRVKVFKKIGSHLKRLRVVFFAECFPHRELMLSSINSIRNMLELTPNLKSLILNFYCQWDDGITATEDQFQFPKLPQSLDHLVLSWLIHSKVICNPFDSVREYFPQLVELEIWDILQFQNDYLKNAGLFPKLKTLKLGRDTSFNFSNSWEGKLRKICREIRAPNLVNIEFKFKDSEAYFYWDSAWEDLKARVEMLTRHSLFCLNKLNNFYSNPEQQNQWTGCSDTDSDWNGYQYSRFIIIKLSPKLY